MRYHIFMYLQSIQGAQQPLLKHCTPRTMLEERLRDAPPKCSYNKHCKHNTWWRIYKHRFALLLHGNDHRWHCAEKVFEIKYLISHLLISNVLKSLRNMIH
jgi:hypothetical protein